jgi:hypothetical protein
MVMLRPKTQMLSTTSIATNRSSSPSPSPPQGNDQPQNDEPIENIKIIDFGLANHLSEL